MFDARLRPLIDPPLNAAARRLVRLGVSADLLTWSGAALGLLGAAAAAFGLFWAAAALIALNRIFDGLDGAVARQSSALRAHDRATDAEADPAPAFGGFLDIVCDFWVYAALPLGFAVYAPDENALAAAFLLAAYLVNAAAFFAFAALAAKTGRKTDAQGAKSIYYLAGLAEGGETVLAMLAMCVFPQAFALIACGFGALVLVSAAARIALARRALG